MCIYRWRIGSLKQSNSRANFPGGCAQMSREVSARENDVCVVIKDETGMGEGKKNEKE